MNYTDLLRMLLEATVKGLVVWNYLDMNGKPIDYPPHHILGEVWGYEAKVGEIELRLFPRFIQGEDTQIFAVTLVGDKGDEYNRVSSHTDIVAFSGVEHQERYALPRLYIAVRKECMRRHNKKQFKKEYSRRMRRRSVGKILPKKWSVRTLIKVFNPTFQD